MKYTINTEIYYKGDNANIPDFGKITNIDNNYTITLDDGRVFRGIFEAMIGGSMHSGMHRFMLKSEYDKEKNKVLNYYKRT